MVSVFEVPNHVAILQPFKFKIWIGIQSGVEVNGSSFTHGAIIRWTDIVEQDMTGFKTGRMFTVAASVLC